MSNRRATVAFVVLMLLAGFAFGTAVSRLVSRPLLPVETSPANSAPLVPGQ